MNFVQKKILFGIILVISLPIIYLLSFNLEFKKEDLKTISGTLTIDPEFKKGNKGKRYLVLHLDEFDNKFNTESFSYHVLKKDKLKSQVKKGDKIYLSIKKNDTKSLVDKINTKLDIIRIMELWTDKEVYISIEDYNEYRKSDFKLTYLFWLASLIYYVYWMRKNSLQHRV